MAIGYEPDTPAGLLDTLHIQNERCDQESAKEQSQARSKLTAFTRLSPSQGAWMAGPRKKSSIISSERIYPI